MPTATKLTRKERLNYLRSLDKKPIDMGAIAYKDGILKYCQRWRNLFDMANYLSIGLPPLRTSLKRLEAEGLMESRQDGEEWQRTPDSWLSEDWLNSEKQSIEGVFSFSVSVGRKLISFEIGEEGNLASDKIWRFEISKRSLISMVKKYNILQEEYIAAYINTHLTPKLSTCIPSGDRYFFIDEKFKILQLDEEEISKILDTDSEIKVAEFFLLKANEKNLKRGDRLQISHYQFGIFEILPNEWEFLRSKKPYHCEIKRGDGLGDNFQKLPLWKIKKCLPIANSSEESEDSASPSEIISPKSEQPDTATLTKMRSPSTQAISPISPSTEISALSSQNGENTTSSQSHSLVPGHQTQATAKGSHIQSQPSGGKDCESSAKSDPNMQSGNNPWELSTEDLENCLEESDWLDILSSLQKSKREASGRHISAGDYLSLPTMTANAGTANSRPSGANKCEKKFEELGLLPNGSKLSPKAMSLLMGYPANWCEAIAPSEPSTPPASPEAKDETRPESSSVKPSAHPKQGSHSQGCATSQGSRQPQPQNNKLPTAIGDLILITPPQVSAGRIFEVGEIRGGNFITTKEGFCFSPTRYEPFNPVGRKLKIDSQHPTLGDRIVEAIGYKNGYIKIVGGGCVALEMVSIASHQSPVNNQPKEAIAAKAISLWQPWASLIGMGRKCYETRHWSTDYRGKLLICAAKKKPSKAELDYFQLTSEDAPLGVTIACVDLTDCILMTQEFIAQQTQLERDCGNWKPGRYAWKLENIIAIDPQPIRGYQGLWDIDDLSLYLPTTAKKKRGRRKGSANKKAASGHIHPRKDSQNWIYQYWDIEQRKKRSLSVHRDKVSRVKKAIDEGKSVSEIKLIIRGAT